MHLSACSLTRTLLLLALAVPFAVQAQDQDGFSNPLDGLGRVEGLGQECLAGDFECFQLFNRCEPINVGIGVSIEDAERSVRRRLTEDSVRTAVESRLRAARLYDPNSGPFLLVAVDVLNNSFTTSVSFRKWLADELTGNIMLAGAYETGRFGTHGDDAGFILQGISELMDGFINDYLRVNGAACN